MVTMGHLGQLICALILSLNTSIAAALTTDSAANNEQQQELVQVNYNMAAEPQLRVNRNEPAFSRR